MADSIRITGRVISEESRRGAAGLHVQVWDADRIVDRAISSVITNAKGEFRIHFTRASFEKHFGDRSPDLFFKVLSGDTLLASTEGSVVWNAATEHDHVEIEVTEADAANADAAGAAQTKAAPPAQHGCGEVTAPSYTVSGVVSSPDRAGMGSLQVLIMDVGVGDKHTLAQVTTNDCGYYTATFTGDAVTARGKKLPDIQAQVYNAGSLIASSDVKYNAGSNETLNVSVPANTVALPGEYDALKTSLSTHYQGSLASLKEDDNQHDITFLANKSGWDARAVAVAALAEQFSNDAVGADGTVAIAPVYFYALFRTGMPTDPVTVYNTDPEVVRDVLTRAAGQGIISQADAGNIPTVVNQFQSLSAQKLLTNPPAVGITPMRDLLLASGLRQDQLSFFAAIYVENKNTPDELWQQAGESFGDQVANQLKLDGKMAYMTLNNGPLMETIKNVMGRDAFKDASQLPSKQFYDAAKWSGLLTDQVRIPDEIPGDTTEEKSRNYAEFLAAQVRVSYPTAVMSALITDGRVNVNSAPDVASFLSAHQDTFDVGAQPVEQYISQNSLQVDSHVVTEVKRVQRVYQMTTTDSAMAGLLDNGVDAAADIVRYTKDAFVQTFGDQVGSDADAALIHDRAVQIHNITLNIAMSYITAANGIPLGNPPLQPDDDPDASRQIMQPAPMGPGSIDLSAPRDGGFGARTGAHANDVLAYATLESLFGSMDFCTCEECRSILSPAAYLADLLFFTNQATPPVGTMNPQTVLLARRPDLAQLPLTCENTNTAMPYIDVVNETLEYYIANGVALLSLNGYVGHDTGTAESEDLLASPVYVSNAAYTTLANERFPAPLPFNQPLENLRRYFAKFEVPLQLSMERLRPNDNLERLTSPYGWRDILMEELSLSRTEYEVLTDSTTDPLWRMYGFPSGTTDASVVTQLSNAKNFCRRLEISYEDLVALLQTRFINPSCDLIPKLEHLGVNFVELQALKVLNNPAGDAAFDALLPTGAGAPDPAAYGGDIKAWVKNAANYARIMGLITLTDTTGHADVCSFNTLELRFATPMTSTLDTSTRLTAVEYIRILRFVRLWKKSGWTMEQTDAAICSLFRTDLATMLSTDIDTKAKLDTGFLTLLPRIGIIVRVMRQLNLTVNKDLLPLLACWTDIGTKGDTALYRQMFLNPIILNQDPVYADNGYGDFLINPAVQVLAHVESVRAALNLTGDEFNRIYAAVPGFTPTTQLSLSSISAIYRRGYLARVLQISVRELLLLINLTGLDPFAAPSATAPAILLLAGLVQDLKDASLKSDQALYLIWNQDLSGQSAPAQTQVNDFARTLRDDFSKIENEFSIVDDPTGEIARARMTLVYGTDAADFFFGLLNNTFVTSATYSHVRSGFDPVLAAAIASTGGTYGTPALPRLTYDDFRKQISYAGVLDLTTKNAIRALATNASVVSEINTLAPGTLAAFQSAFQAAVDALYVVNTAAVTPFFARYAELLPLYQAYVVSIDPPATRRTTLLANFLPSLVSRRKVQQALQRLADAAQTDRAFAEAIVYPSLVANGLHAAGSTTQPALNDIIALQTQGLSAQFYNSNTAGTNPQLLTVAPNLVYAAASSNTLPGNTLTPGNPISGVWSGSIESPENALYNIVIDAEASSTVSLKIDGVAVPLTQVSTNWHNTTAITFKAGTLYAFELTVSRVVNTLSVQWESAGRGRTPIPARLLYPSTLFTVARDSYVRFLKAGALASALKLTAAETARPVLSGASWLNTIPVVGSMGSPSTLLAPLRELLDFARMKAAIYPADESLLNAMRDPVTATATPTSLLYALTGWDSASLTSLVTQFVGTMSNLSNPTMFRRVYDAFALVRTMGISAGALIAATTNNPTATQVRDLQAALRARYAAADWRDVVKPINDQMRSLQRDALVAYILHQLRSDPTTQHIDTADKLFEYFLMDVQMEPCMETSRIRHALSSVQLFIERCLMNLEPEVAPISLNGEHWEWMKRYRVWEANRKVFLYPENWLEPELRDDKSPFFKEIEAELLQSDVTEESVTVAMLNYLAKLEEVAKLEPCGFYVVEANPSLQTGEVNHVVARTAGAHRKYYYRRREYGYWTPWEQIKLDIEDNPVVPVIWKDRLMLLWVKILKQGMVTDTNAIPVSSNGSALGDLSMATFTAEAKNSAAANGLIKHQAVLCWSEYYNGKWQPTKTSDLEHPADLGVYPPGGVHAFNRTALSIDLQEENDALRININDNSTAGGCSFLLYNTHSVPDQGGLVGTLAPWLRYRFFTGNNGNDFSFTYSEGICLTQLHRNVLKPTIAYSNVFARHPLNDYWGAPLFYQDFRHVFYVSTLYKVISIPNFVLYGNTARTGLSSGAGLPGLVLTGSALAQAPATWGGAGVALQMSPASPAAAQRFVTEDANIHQAIGATASVIYQGKEIGPSGQMAQGH